MLNKTYKHILFHLLLLFDMYTSKQMYNSIKNMSWVLNNNF